MTRITEMFLMTLRWLAENTHMQVGIGVAFAHFSYVIMTTSSCSAGFPVCQLLSLFPHPVHAQNSQQNKIHCLEESSKGRRLLKGGV